MRRSMGLPRGAAAAPAAVALAAGIAALVITKA
jgi:hypothetical protein